MAYLTPECPRTGPSSCARHAGEAWGIESTEGIMNHRKAGYTVLRVTVGTICPITSCVKFGIGRGSFVAAVQQEFAGKLPVFLVGPLPTPCRSIE